MSHPTPALAVHPTAAPLASVPTGYSPPALEPTAHPAWVTQMIAALREPWEAASWPSLYRRTAAGELPPLSAWRRMLRDAFVIVENFPKYMGLSLAKTTYGHRPNDTSVRRWLLQNLMVESRHADWYIDWMEGIGISNEQALSARPTPAFQALHEHLMETCRSGSLAEGVAASNWAIEGITGLWTPPVYTHFEGYAEQGARIDSRSMRWLKSHARYDDAHPEEALEIIKLYTEDTADGPRKVEAAARRSLELFTAASAGYDQ